ncbi:MAG: glycosyltransferase family 92 protein, partial [Solirubrobacterales bacterium]
MTELPKAYLSVCAVYKDEAPYLREWIEFHRLVGVERFFLYNHASVDDHRAALAPYIEDGIVTLEDWPDVANVQFDIYDHCLEQHRQDSCWIAFIDIDEFLFSPTGRPLSELLVEYERWPGVAANWAMFGSSGHRTKPAGLVIENYVWRSDSPELEHTRRFKCIVDPARATRCFSSHGFDYTEGTLVDEDKQPIAGGFSERSLYSRIRINHYYTRSEEECIRKFARPRVNDSALMRGGEAPLEDLHMSLHDKRDDTILMYAPALKEALARTNERAPFDAAPAPAPDEATAAGDGKVRYFEWGPAALRCVEAAVECARRLLPRGAAEPAWSNRILVFPSGRGQVLRVIRAAYPDARITACDLDRDAVDFCAEVFDAVPLYADEDPARIETDAAFDLIWCGSLFTHLDSGRWLPFLEFLEARLRPWGLLLLATNGRHLAPRLGPPEMEVERAEEMRAEFAQTGFSHRDGLGLSGRYDRDGRGLSGWGTTIASLAWMCRRLEARPGLRLLT